MNTQSKMATEKKDTYSEIRCITLCVLHILGFFVPLIILADLLNRCLLA